MKNKRFWPEQIEEARTLAVQEKKFLTREYDAVLDPDIFILQAGTACHYEIRWVPCLHRQAVCQIVSRCPHVGNEIIRDVCQPQLHIREII